ncbi:DNA internalization-related competence protein ComEC/Rec2 [Celerinatantimonas yamalensis]|uniref:DNA internalization-related competence protein ComEC/Rec2 n=1 Tax=Celerinatantimonas yamalensis TaxID=559956 RepID=A0ABW9G526_9GAMM
MKYFILGWLVALSSSLFWPVLPPLPVILCLLLLACGALLKRYYIIAGACLAVSYFSWHAMVFQQAVQQLAGQDRYHIIQGQIVAVSNHPYSQKITLRIAQLDQQRPQWVMAQFVYLSQYWSNRRTHHQRWHMGQQITVKATLKATHGSLNEGGFNYQRYLVAHAIIATGSIHHVIQQSPGSHFRTRLLAILKKDYAHIPQDGMIQALSVGDKVNIDAKQKRRWMNAGVGHLLAISGLHLGILAFWGFLLGRLLSLLWPQMKRFLPAMSAMLLAGMYGYLANWPVSAQRAQIMLMLWLTMTSLRIPITRMDAWLVAAFMVSLGWPLAILSGGLWLSFAAMLAVLVMLWVVPIDGWYRILLIQLGLVILLLPLQIWLFGYFSLWSIPLNLCFIPIFSFLVIPLLMVASVCAICQLHSAAHIIYHLVGWGLEWLDKALVLLTHISSLALPIPHHLWPHLLLGLILLAIILRLRSRGAIAALLLWAIAPNFANQAGRWQVDFLDVGQGLSVIVQSHGHALIYDTGNRYRSGFSYARSVILPFLHESRLNIDMIVLSHADRDHAGGYRLLHQKYPQAQSIFGADPRFKVHNCQGVRHWQSLRLQFIQPNVDERSPNDHSCILMISDAYHRVLLTGDIEKPAETWWLKQPFPPVDGLSVPHHGSHTSSSKLWLERIRPHWAVISSGFDNYYHFPHPSVVRRYQHLGIHLYNTANLGQIAVKFHLRREKIISYRQNLAPFWYNRLLVDKRGW